VSEVLLHLLLEEEEGRISLKKKERKKYKQFVCVFMYAYITKIKRLENLKNNIKYIFLPLC